MITRVRRVLNGIVERGPGYEPTPLGRFLSTERVHGYFLDFTSKTEVARPLAPTPAWLVQYGLGAWDRWLASETRWRGVVERTCHELAANAEWRGNEARWGYTVPVRKYGLYGRWYSALAQGQIASLFVRAAVAFDDHEYRRIAEAAVEPRYRYRSSR